MIKHFLFVIFIVVSLSACAQNTSVDDQQPAAAAHGPAMDQGAPAGWTGEVTETMDAGNYTYVKVSTGGEEIWAAAPTFKVAVGDTVTVPQGMPMQNFHSDSLDRDFPLIYFVAAIGTGGEMAPAGGMPAGHPPVTQATGVDTSDVKPIEGATAIGDLYAKKDELGGSNLVFHGKVVKANMGIMGRNWLHIQDGTGDAADGSNDLTVTTDAVAAVGDIVTVSGAPTLNKDFGAGYRYDVIIENAKVTVE